MAGQTSHRRIRTTPTSRSHDEGLVEDAQRGHRSLRLDQDGPDHLSSKSRQHTQTIEVIPFVQRRDRRAPEMVSTAASDTTSTACFDLNGLTESSEESSEGTNSRMNDMPAACDHVRPAACASRSIRRPMVISNQGCRCRRIRYVQVPAEFEEDPDEGLYDPGTRRSWCRGWMVSSVLKRSLLCSSTQDLMRSMMSAGYCGRSAWVLSNGTLWR